MPEVVHERGEHEGGEKSVQSGSAYFAFLE